MNNKKIITPINKIEVEIKEWITGGEYNEIQKPMTDVKMTIDSKGVSQGEINAGEITRQSLNKAIEIVIISINGKKENKIKEVENLRREDYDFVIQEINKIVKGENFTTPSLN